MRRECLPERLCCTDSGHAGPLEKRHVTVEPSDAMRPCGGSGGNSPGRAASKCAGLTAEGHSEFPRYCKENGVSEYRGNDA